MAKTNFQSIDEYIAACPEETHERLQEIREEIKKLAPDARERISYQIAAFESEVSKYADGKGTVKFPLDEPMPMKLVRKIIKLHLAQNLKMAKSKK